MYQISSFWNNPNKCLTGMVNQPHSLATNLTLKNLLRLGKGLFNIICKLLDPEKPKVCNYFKKDTIALCGKFQN